MYIDGRTNTNFNDTVLKKGRSLLNSGFIENTQDNYSPCSSTFLSSLRALVHHSMKSDIPLEVTISNVSGHVKKCTCKCKANALGRCAHISYILLMHSDYVSLNSYIINVPSTSLPCVWNKGKIRTKNHQDLHKILHKSNKGKDANKLHEWDPRPEKYRNVVSS